MWFPRGISGGVRCGKRGNIENGDEVSGLMYTFFVGSIDVMKLGLVPVQTWSETAIFD